MSGKRHRTQTADADPEQLANGLFAQAAGGVFGQGFGQSILTTASGAPLIPEPQTDMIYAVITSELGLFGAGGVLLTYLLFVYRGLKIAILARDSFSKLLATGLSAVFALQVFVIVGGVTKAIPLTGVTLPFISYGGTGELGLRIAMPNGPGAPKRVFGLLDQSSVSRGWAHEVYRPSLGSRPNPRRAIGFPALTLGWRWCSLRTPQRCSV